MIVYLFYEEIVREYKALCNLKKTLEKKGHTVYIFSIIFETNEYLRTSKKSPPDVIYMPWFYNEVEENAIYPLIKRNKNLKIINMHQEELSSPDTEHYYDPKTKMAKNAIYHVVWGDFFKDFLIRYNVPSDRIFVTGNFRTDLLKKTIVTRKELSEKYKLNPEKKWILFAESRGYFTQRKQNGELELLANKINYSVIERNIQFDIDCFKSLKVDLSNVNSDFFKKYEFIYRPHPGTSPETGLPDWLKIISDLPISDWISNVDLFVARASTSIIEAEISGVPCCQYENPSTPKEDLIPGFERYPIITSINDISDELIDELSRNNRHLYEDYFGVVDGKATERVADALDKVIALDDGISNLEYYKNLKKPSAWYYTKRAIYEIVVKFLVKTRLIEVIKRPRSAYIRLKDIPYYSKNNWKDA